MSWPGCGISEVSGLALLPWGLELVEKESSIRGVSSFGELGWWLFSLFWHECLPGCSKRERPRERLGLVLPSEKEMEAVSEALSSCGTPAWLPGTVGYPGLVAPAVWSEVSALSSLGLSFLM